MKESKWNLEKEKLIELIITKGKSYKEVGRIYGCSGSNIKKVMKDTLNIELPQRRIINPKETFNIGKFSNTCKNCGNPISSIKTYCSIQCESEYKHKQKYQKILNGDSSIMNAKYSPSSFRLDILKELGNVCAICKISPEWNGKPLIFIVDHIDGRASNNIRTNLRCICPNCDSLLDTYKSKNKNSDRNYYRYNYRSAFEETQNVEEGEFGETPNKDNTELNQY